MKLLWAVYAVMWAGGTLVGGVSPETRWAAPLFLVVAGILTIAEHRVAWKSLAIAALLGVAFELAGVHTGLPFGRYVYTETLAPAVFGVPVVIAFAWLVLIDFVRGLTPSIAAGALLMTAADLVIDPLAAGPLHYWRWLDPGPYYGIPWLNFAGWMLASLVILALMPKTSRRMSWTGWSVILFFTVLAIERRLWLPALIGAGIVIGSPVMLRNTQQA